MLKNPLKLMFLERALCFIYFSQLLIKQETQNDRPFLKAKIALYSSVFF